MSESQQPTTTAVSYRDALAKLHPSSACSSGQVIVARNPAKRDADVNKRSTKEDEQEPTMTTAGGGGGGGENSNSNNEAPRLRGIQKRRRDATHSDGKHRKSKRSLSCGNFYHRDFGNSQKEYYTWGAPSLHSRHKVFEARAEARLATEAIVKK